MEADIKNEDYKKIFGEKAVGGILGGILVWLLSDFLNTIVFDVLFSMVITYKMPDWIYIMMRSIGCIIVTYCLLSIYIKKYFNASMGDFRISKIHIKPIYIVCAFVLPVFVVLCLVATGGAFINNAKNEELIFSIIIIALFRALNAGILEEMIFRGYIMKLLECKYNKKIAVLLPSIFFATLHIPSMEKFNMINLFLLLCAGTGVGVMFSLITYVNKSIWASVLVHTIWNMCMIGGILDISTIHNADAAFSFILSSNNLLITGGGFGIEASIFAIIGYTIVALLSLVILRKEKLKI